MGAGRRRAHRRRLLGDGDGARLGDWHRHRHRDGRLAPRVHAERAARHRPLARLREPKLVDAMCRQRREPGHDQGGVPAVGRHEQPRARTGLARPNQIDEEIRRRARQLAEIHVRRQQGEPSFALRQRAAGGDPPGGQRVLGHLRGGSGLGRCRPDGPGRQGRADHGAGDPGRSGLRAAAGSLERREGPICFVGARDVNGARSPCAMLRARGAGAPWRARRGRGRWRAWRTPIASRAGGPRAGSSRCSAW